MYNHFSPKYSIQFSETRVFDVSHISNLHHVGMDLKNRKNPPFRTPLGFLLNNWSLVPGDFSGCGFGGRKKLSVTLVFEAQKHLDFRHQTLQFLPPPKKKWKTLEISLICNGIYNDRFEHKRESKCQIFSNNFEIDFDFFLRISWLSPEALCEIMGPSKESQLRFNNDAINNAQQQKKSMVNS